MENKILITIIAILMAFTFCSCGNNPKKNVFETIPKEIVSTTDDGDSYQFKGKSKGKTVIYTMTQEGTNFDIYRIPDKIFAPLLANGKKGISNEVVLSVLNYQYTTPEWSAYYFHNALFAFSDAVLKRQVNTFKIKREKGQPFFVGRVKLGKNGMPEVVRIDLEVPPTKTNHMKGGKDSATYRFQYNQKKNINHVDFKEKSDWEDQGTADISISYKKDENEVLQISKSEKNPNGKFEYAFSPKYKNGVPERLYVTRDTTDSSQLNPHNSTFKNMDYTFSGTRYTGFGGYRQRIAKNTKGENLYNPNGKLRYKEVKTATDYKYDGNLITSLIVEDNLEDTRTYKYQGR